ncbi:MAG: hypothetical protein VB876_16800 [Pirellulales bacterium]
MKEVLLSLPGIALTVLCWGAYGSVLHKGQALLDQSKLKPLICVGAAYFVIAIIVPVAILISQGKLGGGWSFGGVSWSLAAGAAGALGALGIILALTSGGKPIYVMPLVFGCAPIINVFVSMYFAKIPWRNVSPIFIAGMILVAVGAITVLVFQPRPPKPSATSATSSPEAGQSLTNASNAIGDGSSNTSSPAEKDASVSDQNIA